MNKKIALKRKKLINQIRHHRVLPNGRILTADGRETLLGNLAPVKSIPMLPWRKVMILPSEEKTISVAVEGKNAWFYKLLESRSKHCHDLIGFTPVGALDEKTFGKIGAGSVGIAAQVRKIEPPTGDGDGRATVHLKGICRYENTGFQPATSDDYFCINVHWFEDDREADALVKPQFERGLSIVKAISEVISKAGLKGFDGNQPLLTYDFTAVQYLSFSMLQGAQEHFEEAEKRELLAMRSTSQRFKRINEYLEEFLEEVKRRFAGREAGD